MSVDFHLWVISMNSDTSKDSYSVHLRLKRQICVITILASSIISPYAIAGDIFYVCAENESIGFNWRDGQWVKTNFKGDTYSVRKVDRSLYKDSKTKQSNQTMFCDAEKEAKVNQRFDGGIEMKYSCYSITELGSKPWLLSYGMCLETFKYGSLESVTCSDSRNFAFSVDGQFIKAPGSLNVGNVNKKDSMALSVGTCRPAN